MAESTRDRITKSARNLFVLRGYRNTTVDDIARDAGVSKRTVYEAFDSKEEIARQVVEEGLEDFQTQMRAIIKSSDDPLKKLCRLSRFYIDLPSPGLSSTALIDLQRDLPSLWERIEKVETGILREMHQVIDEGKELHVFRTDLSTEMVITALTGALKTTMAPEFLLNSSHSLEEVYTSLFELITRGVCARSDIVGESRTEIIH